MLKAKQGEKRVRHNAQNYCSRTSVLYAIIIMDLKFRYCILEISVGFEITNLTQVKQTKLSFGS